LAKKRRDVPTEALDPSTYEGIGYDELVTFAVAELEDRGEEATFEHIVAECFRLFPSRFRLQGYPAWPDSSKVNKSWLRARTDKGYLVGRVKEGFQLTAKGKEAAGHVGEQLRGTRPRPTRRKRVQTDTKEASLVEQLATAPAFLMFVQTGSVADVSEYDFRDALICTMDTPASVLNGNLSQFENAARALARDDVSRFLALSREKFTEILRPDKDDYSGGMMRQQPKRKAVQ
jgi:hypothetical protein